MQIWIPDQLRLMTLIVACGLLWSLESMAPLYRGHPNRLRRSIPNLALTVLLVITNITLSFISAWVASFTVQNEFGPLSLVDFGGWAELALSVVGIDDDEKQSLMGLLKMPFAKG